MPARKSEVARQEAEVDEPRHSGRRCSLFCDHSHPQKPAWWPVSAGTTVQSSASGMLRPYRATFLRATPVSTTSAPHATTAPAPRPELRLPASTSPASAPAIGRR